MRAIKLICGWWCHRLDVFWRDTEGHPRRIALNVIVLPEKVTLMLVVVVVVVVVAARLLSLIAILIC